MILKIETSLKLNIATKKTKEKTMKESKENSIKTTDKCGYKSIIEIQEELIKLKDDKFKSFHSRLMPNINNDKILGVKMPIIRKLAKKVTGSGLKEEFLSILPHRYYEENNIHAAIIDKISDFDDCIFQLDRFLPFVDNWATCDMMNPKVLRKDKKSLYEHIKKWIHSEYVYEIRFGILMLMREFLAESFDNEHIKLISGIDNDDYYVKMAVSWYFATAFCYNYDDIIKYFENGFISDDFIFNKSIQKATESFRIDEQKKTYLKFIKNQRYECQKGG